MSESFRQDIGKFHSPQMKPCELEENVQTIFEISTGKLTVMKRYSVFIVKNPTDFRKTVEAGVDPRLHLNSIAKLI